ncbi:MAG: proline dehydrogenase family protein, partial [Brumimicrobium sp.]
MIDFNNTKIAFDYKSTLQLRKAKVMFKLVAKTWVVKVSKWATKFALFFRIPMRPFVKPTIFSQFCGGETIEECDKTIGLIGKYNVGSILDYSVEGAEEVEAHEKTTRNILKTIEKAATDPKIPYAVFKVTGIARDSFLERINDSMEDMSSEDHKEYEEVLDRIDSLCQSAHEADVPIYIDAEDYSMQNVIDNFAWQMITKYNKKKAIVFNTIQAYRVDRFDFLVSEHKKTLKAGVKYGVKLVRGAYMEKEREWAKEYGYPSPIHKNKDATDKCFNKCMNYIVDHLDDFSLCLGTHNEESTIMLTELMKKRGVKKSDDR